MRARALTLALVGALALSACERTYVERQVPVQNGYVQPGYSPGYSGGDVAAGMAAGMALGYMMNSRGERVEIHHYDSSNRPVDARGSVIPETTQQKAERELHQKTLPPTRSSNMSGSAAPAPSAQTNGQRSSNMTGSVTPPKAAPAAPPVSSGARSSSMTGSTNSGVSVQSQPRQAAAAAPARPSSNMGSSSPSSSAGRSSSMGSSSSRK